LKQRIVFACSGSPDNLAAIPHIAATHDAEIVTLTLDVGQERGLESVRQAAIAAGASRAHVLDVREEFARECILGSFQEGGHEEHPLDQRLARPLIARKLVEVALIEAADTIAHAGDSADHEAISSAAHAIDPLIRVVSASTASSAASANTVHTTLWGRSIEGASDRPDESACEQVYSLTATSRRAPDSPAHLEISFESGLPVAVNGVPMRLTEFVESVTTIAGNHGVGRVTYASGARSETPAAVVLHAAHEALGSAALSAPAATVRVELFKGQHRVVSAQHS